MNIEQLISDIRMTFPSLHTMLREECINKKSVWMVAGEQKATMPDGLPIFSEWAYEEGNHEDGIHVAFSRWLANRGFYLENEDGFWHRPIPFPTREEVARMTREYEEALARYRIEHPDEVDDGCPF